MEFTIPDTKLFMSHLMCSSTEVCNEVACTTKWTDEKVLEATLQINGVGVPAEVLELFMKNLWEQANERAKEKYDENKFDERVEARAKLLLREHADNALEQVQELSRKLEEIEDVLTPSWERK